MSTHTQDPIDPFTLRIEELRRRPRPRGLAGLVHDLFLDLFTRLLMLLASLAERGARTGTLPDPALAPQGGASPRPTGAPDPSRVPPPDPRPQQSGWLEHRPPEAEPDGDTMHQQFEQPEMPPDINQPIAEAPQADRLHLDRPHLDRPHLDRPQLDRPHLDRIMRPPCRMPVVEQPAGPPLAHVRKPKKQSAPTPVRPQPVYDGCWPRWRGPGILRTREAGFLRLDSKKPVCAAVRCCVHFVTI